MGWGRFLHAKKSLYLYTDILKWDDSASEEAFHTAKTRFWAEVNNRRPPKNSSAAGPDVCVDAIDWNQDTTDPGLYKDWDRLTIIDEQDAEVTAECVIDQPVVATGWDDDDEPYMGNLPRCFKSLMKPIMVPSACVDGEDDSRYQSTDNPQDRGCKNYRWKHRSSYAHENFRVNPLWVY